MTDWPASAPAEYSEAIKCLPTGFETSDRMVSPVLIIQRTGAAFAVTLAGRRTVRDKVTTSLAPSIDHNWVVDNHTIRPIPSDIGKTLKDLLGERNPNELSFSEVIALLATPSELIEVEADDSVFVPAKAEAELLPGDFSISGLHATLFPYQARGVQWMLNIGRHTGGFILADEMGLGKTIQIIAVLLSEKPTPVAPALIVCPTSLIANWKQEILKFGPELSIMVHRGAHRTGITAGLQKAQVVITTYDTLVNDLTIFLGLTWSWVICDEAQAIKNPDSQRRLAVASVPRKRAVPMTGTPVETSLLDLWSLADLAIPGLLGTRTEFEEKFPNEESSAKALANFTNPIVLRRRVADVANDLPERIDIDVPLELGPELSDLYNQVLEDTLQKYPVAGAMVATGQLQLFCAHPWLRGAGTADESDDAVVAGSPAVPLVTPKIERTIAILHEAFQTGQKVLIFAIFNKCGDLIRECARDLPSAYWGAINGATAQEERQNIVDAFTDYPGPGCLVLNPKAAGAGLNITAATIVIHYTQAWNPALEAQASARAHRRGQTEPVRIFRLFYEDTVERVMIDRAEWRRQLGNDAVPISTREDADLKRALSFRPRAQNV
ncbi:MAG: DEAD/DEAH box helicase [Casimicrobium sp.]